MLASRLCRSRAGAGSAPRRSSRRFASVPPRTFALRKVRARSSIARTSVVRKPASSPRFFGGILQRRTFALPAHGPSGKLVNLLVDDKAALLEEGHSLPSIVLTQRQICDAELLINGGFSPLNGFMGQRDTESVMKDMRLADGTLWTVPINLDVNDDTAAKLKAMDSPRLALRDMEGNTIGVVDVTDVWKADKAMEAEAWGGDAEHPAVVYLNKHTHNNYVGGALRAAQLPPHYDYSSIRRTPAELRKFFADNKWDKVVAFQTRNPLHRAHFELTLRALEVSDDMHLLLHPVVGQTKPGDIDHHTRVKCYQEIMPRYPDGRAHLSVFPLAMRMGGPREAVWHAIIRKNHGATHFILGRDHAGPGSNSKGEDFYGPYDARDFALQHAEELKMTLLPFEMQVYVEDEDKYYSISQVPEGKEALKLSGTEVRRRLATGDDIPEWFSFPEVVKHLRHRHPPKSKQGYCVFFTGLSGSGKTTIANALVERLMEMDNRSISVLDGDHVRQMLSSELGFSEEHRDLNVRRIGFVAGEIVSPGGAVISALIAPYRRSRDAARASVEKGGAFIEVHLDTPVESCEERDRKGLYKLAREGKLANFTGISDPYEVPENAEVTIDTSTTEIGDAVQKILDYLVSQGFIKKQA